MKARLLLLSPVLFLFAACGSAPTADTAMEMELPDYRIYVRNINNNVRTADAESFEIGEQTRLVDVSDQILATLGEANDFNELNTEQQQNVAIWNDELHVLMIGADESRSAGRICRTESATGSNIRSRSCRTREQLTRERQSARMLLMNRSDDVDRILLDDQTRPASGFGSPDLNN